MSDTPLRVQRLVVHHLALPYARPWVTRHHGASAVRRTALIELTCTAGDELVTGWGELAALDQPGYVAETLDGELDALRAELAPALVHGAAELDRNEHQPARAALEVALLDADLRRRGESLATWLGATRPRVTAGAVVGVHADLGALLAEAEEFARAGYRRLKIKVAPGHDVAVVEALRAALGEQIELAVDANAGYADEPASDAALAAMDAQRLVFVEQPFAVEAIEPTIRVAAALAAPVTLDESIVSLADVENAFALGAIGAVQLKWSRLGGVAAARAAHDFAVDHELPAWVGGMVESGVGRWINVALAAMPGCTITGDLSASARFFTDDVCEPVVVGADGSIAVHDGPGVCPEPDRAALSRLSTRTEVLVDGGSVV